MNRQVYCADAREWMAGRPPVGGVVTSLPDADETGYSIEQWKSWFVECAGLCMDLANPDSATVFYQTDRKVDGYWLSKTELLFDAQKMHAGMRLLWHKIVLRRDIGKKDLYRPGYTHMLAFSRKARTGAVTSDVFDRGVMVYPNGMGLRAAELAVRFVGRNTTTICDPFCGRGTVLAVANALGLDAIGVDIDPDQAECARSLTLSMRPSEDRELLR